MKPMEITTTESWSLPREGAGGLQVRTPAGDVQAEAEETPEIRVEVVRRVRAGDEAAGRAFLERMALERARDGEQWVVQASWPEPRKHAVEAASASFRVRLPAGMKLEAASGHGNLQASGVAAAQLRTGAGDCIARDIAGSVDARSGHGRIQIETCGGAVEGETGSGDIRVHGVGGRVRVATGHGSIEVQDCAGPAEIETKAGEARVERVPERVEVTSGHGRIEVAEVAEAKLRTGSGDVVARDVDGRLEARSGHGRIEVERCGGSVEVETGSGDLLLREVAGTVHATTGHGRVQVEETGAAHLQSGAGDLRAARVTGSLEARTGHGNAEIETCDGPVTVDSRAGNLKVEQAGSPLTASTGHGAIGVVMAPQSDNPLEADLSGNGPIHLDLPRAASARLEARTGAGTIQINAPGSAQTHRGRGRVNTVLGGGEGTIRVRTGIGDIHVRMEE